MRPIAFRPADERGLALPLTLFALTVLALLAAALAGATTSELESERWVDWDRKALYAAEAGVEHQIYELKRNKSAGPVGTVSLGVFGDLDLRYSVDLQCVALRSAGGSCSENRESRTWEVTSRGQLVRGGTVVHERSVWALVEIRYCGGAASSDPACPSGGSVYGTPRAVLVRRWEVR